MYHDWRELRYEERCVGDIEPKLRIALFDEIRTTNLESEASQFLIGTKGQMEEQISNAEKIFVVRKNAIKMIIKRYSRGCWFYGVGDMC